MHAARPPATSRHPLSDLPTARSLAGSWRPLTDTRIAPTPAGSRRPPTDTRIAPAPAGSRRPLPRRVGVLAVVLLSSFAPAALADAPKSVATRYLNAVTAGGDPTDRELLFGGPSFDAQIFELENWRIVKRDRPRRERGELAEARALMKKLDDEARDAIGEAVGFAGDTGAVALLDGRATRALLAETKVLSDALEARFPVLAYVARIGKPVFWEPRNPFRRLLRSLPDAGPYEMELHLFHVETREGPRKVPRVWPLRVLRIRAGQTDTGWKVLPASDWSVE